MRTVLGIGFALFVLVPLVIPSAAAGPFSHEDPLLTSFAGVRDRDGNGVEDVLDDWRAGRATWTAVRGKSVAGALSVSADKAAPAWEAAAAPPGPGPWSRGHTRILHFGGDAASALDKAAGTGACELLHRTDRFGGLQVLALDEAGLAAYLDSAPGGTILLDRDGVPALAETRPLVGADRLYGPAWELGDDWTGTVAILDSGCDTAHGDLGDYVDDDVDGPAPAVGDPGDWYPADDGWPLFDGYKVVGWHDVTDDFPAAAGPWDYHHHGTSLSSVVAGAGREDPTLNGVVPGGRLTVVKFYDFDTTWHAWAGDFLAACDWVLANRETYRIRAVLAAVNWDVDAGISAAMSALMDAGVVPVVAAGNHGTTGEPGYPAAAVDALTCGGVNHAGEVAAFSGRGRSGQGKPDLVAPAGGLLPAAGRVRVCDNEPDDSYSDRWGTSLAAAFAAGSVYVLDETLRERGTRLGSGRDAARLRILALEATCAPVTTMETADGTGSVLLNDAAVETAGAGLLRVDAAVALLADPLPPGVDQPDTLSVDWSRPVVARRLVTAAGVRYLVEVVPDPGLDISLHVLDPVGILSGQNDVSVAHDLSGPGVSEFVYVRPDPGHWLGLVVKRQAGAGRVTLRLREADSFPSQTTVRNLPGMVSAAPNAGFFGSGGDPALIVSSRVTVDDAARALSYLGAGGVGRSGWPVFLFPHSSAQGNLQQPLVWNLDGAPGDEIVVGSEFGNLYFVDADGEVLERELAFNRSLTRAVGLETDGGRRVAVVDKLGEVFLWDGAGVLRDQVDLDHALPLAPAVGRVNAAGDEQLVVAFADGYLTVLDTALDPLPGWPLELGEPLTVAPVLVDLDEDGDHEIAVPILSSDGSLRVRLLHGDGTAAPGDGTLLALGGGDQWLAVSGALVTGRHGNGELGLTLAGVVANGAGGDAAAWSSGTATLRGDGSVVSTDFPTFGVQATTTQGQLLLDRALLPTPLAWNQTGGSGTEPAVLMNLDWAEVLYGLTSMPGSVTGWYEPVVTGLPLWNPLVRGGPSASEFGHVASALLDPGDGAYLRVHVFDKELHMVPVIPADVGAVLWPVERADGRNSGAFALTGLVTAVGTGPSRPTGLAIYPNPGSGRFSFRLDGGHGGERLIVDVVDLRGRRVQRLAGTVDGLRWDGLTAAGGPAAAGTYFAVVRTAGGVRSSRFVLTR